MTRVDNVPFYLKPFFWLYGYGCGIFLYAYTRLLTITCRITFVGSPLPENTPAVFCIWHSDLALYFGVFSRVDKHVWMNHPAWYMKPIHVLLRLTGVEHICLGSSGNSGKAALDNVVNYLKQGYTTTIASDGPAGPANQLKPGVLWMSRDAGVPVVPMRFTASRGFRIGGWDRKFLPFLFSEIKVYVGECIYVTESNLNESSEKITKHLNAE